MEISLPPGKQLVLIGENASGKRASLAPQLGDRLIQGGNVAQAELRDLARGALVVWIWPLDLCGS